MAWVEVCFDCGLPLFPAEGHSPADAFGVSAGALYVGPKGWHLECARARKPMQDETTADEPQFHRTELFTMRISRVERVDLNELRRKLEFPSIATMIRWFARAEKLRRARVDEVNRRKAITRPGVPAPAKAGSRAKSAGRRRASRK